MNNRIPLCAFSYLLEKKKRKKKNMQAIHSDLNRLALSFPPAPAFVASFEQTNCCPRATAEPTCLQSDPELRKFVLTLSHDRSETVRCSRSQRGQQPWARMPMCGTQRQKSRTREKETQIFPEFPDLTVTRPLSTSE